MLDVLEIKPERPDGDGLWGRGAGGGGRRLINQRKDAEVGKCRAGGPRGRTKIYGCRELGHMKLVGMREEDCRGPRSIEADDWLRPPLKVTDEVHSITLPSTGPAWLSQRFPFVHDDLGSKHLWVLSIFCLVILMTFPRNCCVYMFTRIRTITRGPTSCKAPLKACHPPPPTQSPRSPRPPPPPPPPACLLSASLLSAPLLSSCRRPSISPSAFFLSDLP